MISRASLKFICFAVLLGTLAIIIFFSYQRFATQAIIRNALGFRSTEYEVIEFKKDKNIFTRDWTEVFHLKLLVGEFAPPTGMVPADNHDLNFAMQVIESVLGADKIALQTPMAFRNGDNRVHFYVIGEPGKKDLFLIIMRF